MDLMQIIAAFQMLVIFVLLMICRQLKGNIDEINQQLKEISLRIIKIDLTTEGNKYSLKSIESDISEIPKGKSPEKE